MEEPLLERRMDDHYSKLCEHIYKWCKNYLFKKDIDNMGCEIAKITKRIIEDENITRKSKNKNDFFGRLNVALNRGKAEYYREFEEKDTITISRKDKIKLRNIKDVLWMQESNLGRKLTDDEKSQCISKWFKKQEYIDLANASNIGSLTFTAKDTENEVDLLNTTATSLCSESTPDSLDDYLSKINTNIILQAVESVLDNKQERSRDCYRALFTLHCIENCKDFEALSPVLDQKIIKKCRESAEKLNKYEVYREYHPNVAENSAQASSSALLANFLRDLEAYLKQNNPEIFQQNH